MNSLRREKIREFVRSNQVVTIDQLTAAFSDVSAMTIHRDLTFLQEQGYLTKVRGGARYIGDAPEQQEPAFHTREDLNRGAKQIMAAKALPLLADASSIFLDAGTTMMALARLLPNTPVNIVTTGPNIAVELAQKSLVNINLCGGSLNKSNLTLSGSAANDYLSRINIEVGILVASGLGGDGGFNCGIENEARIKQLVVQKARTSVMLCDISKYRRLLPYTFANVGDFDYLVTDVEPDQLPEELRVIARKSGTALL